MVAPCYEFRKICEWACESPGIEVLVIHGSNSDTCMCTVHPARIILMSFPTRFLSAHTYSMDPLSLELLLSVRSEYRADSLTLKQDTVLKDCQGS
jgi:hypothetical protein